MPPSPTTRFRPATLGLAPALALALAGLGLGCRMMQGVVDLPVQTVRAVTPGKKNPNAVDPVEVQQKLLRFSDGYSAQMMAGIDKLRRGTNAIEPAEALKWKIRLVTESCSIASGPNALAGLLDMTVFVTISRAGLEEHWMPQVYGSSAQPMLESCRNAESNIWAMAGTILNAQQQEELRQAIAVWRQRHPHSENVLGARAVGFATEVAQAKQSDPAAPGSVFSFLRIDPLSSLDPAMQEIALTRMFAERALYIAQWMPTLLRWQIELMNLNAVALPEVQQVVTNSTQLAASVERFARVAELLPQQVSTEREEILQALQSQEKGLATLAGEVRQTLTAGTEMSTSLNTTLTTFDALMKRFGVGETNPASTTAPDTNSPPFRILDYAQTATQLESAARQLTELLRTLDQTTSATNLAQLSAQLTPVLQQTQASGKELVDYAFWKALLFVVLVLVAVLIYRLLITRLISSRGQSNSP